MIHVIDNVLPDILFHQISGPVTKNSSFMFGIAPTALPTDNARSFYTFPEGFWEQQFFALPMWMAGEKANIQINDISRIRFGLLHRDIEQTINSPHIDNYDAHHMIGLYYLNDTDGSTKIWKQRHTDWGNPAENYTVDDCDLLQEVEPKANRMVIFDGSHYHSSVTPTKTQLRYVINFNFTTGEN